mmetsp:Transcript_41179/g.85974  ORF Transcript_41179/g.85974 Transcript_41179/m.85974 type:complete len:141 (-) Transcript_41179:29-451(-)
MGGQNSVTHPFPNMIFCLTSSHCSSVSCRIWFLRPSSRSRSISESRQSDTILETEIIGQRNLPAPHLKRDGSCIHWHNRLTVHTGDQQRPLRHHLGDGFELYWKLGFAIFLGGLGCKGVRRVEIYQGYQLRPSPASKHRT